MKSFCKQWWDTVVVQAPEWIICKHPYLVRASDDEGFVKISEIQIEIYESMCYHLLVKRYFHPTDKLNQLHRKTALTIWQTCWRNIMRS